MPPTTDVPPDVDPLEGYDPSARAAASAGRPVGGPLSTIEMDAERAILTAILSTPKVFDDVCDELAAADFGAPVHEAIYAAVVACDASGRPFDVITVADEMRRQGTLGQRQGYLQELAVAPVAPDSVTAHVQIVLDRALRRRMVAAARTIGGAALDPSNDAEQALDVAEQEVFNLAHERSAPTLLPAAQVVEKAMAEMARVAAGGILGRSTGLPALDAAIGGLRGGQLILVTGRPAMGKSILALQIAAHVAEAEGLPCPFYSYEMSHEELGMRLLAARTATPLTRLAQHGLPRGEGADRVVAEELARLDQLPLLIESQPPATVTGLRSNIRRLARRGPLGVVVVDYLQLLESGQGGRQDNRNQEVGYISRTLKLLAMELDVPIIAVSQLSRGPESRPDKRPMLADLRDSGSLEQDANLVIAAYRDWVYDKSQPAEDAELLILKNRQGPLDEIAVTFDGPCTTFRSSDRVLQRGPAGGAAGRPGGQPGPAAGPAGRGDQARMDWF